MGPMMGSDWMMPGWLLIMTIFIALLLLGGFYVISRANRRDEAKRKTDDRKPKRDQEREEETYYTVGDDGELVEIDSSVDPFEEDESGEGQAHSARH